MIRVSIRVAAVSLGLLLAHAGLSDNRSLAQGQNSGTVALTGARVIDGTGRPAIEQATIIVAGGKIQEVGPAASVKVPAGATRVDVAGKTIVPGHHQRPWPRRCRARVVDGGPRSTRSRSCACTPSTA